MRKGCKLENIEIIIYTRDKNIRILNVKNVDSYDDAFFAGFSRLLEWSIYKLDVLYQLYRILGYVSQLMGTIGTLESSEIDYN
jgi:hypothetical protein